MLSFKTGPSSLKTTIDIERNSKGGYTNMSLLVLDLHQAPLCRVRMSPCGLMLATCGDRHIRIFHNVAEYFSSVVALEKAIRDAREEAPRRRLQEQLEEARDKLQAVYK